MCQCIIKNKVRIIYSQKQKCELDGYVNGGEFQGDGIQIVREGGRHTGGGSCKL